MYVIVNLFNFLKGYIQQHPIFLREEATQFSYFIEKSNVKE